MSSQQAHLDAGSDREVVYCHACHHEWYRDEHAALECPECHCDVTEIINTANDPREPIQSSPSDFDGAGYNHSNPYPDSDSDPEEANIDDHITSGPGFFMRQRVFPDPSRHRDGRDPTDPSDGDAIFRRFTELLFNDLRMPGPGGQEGAPPRTIFGGSPAIVHRTTIREGPGFGGTATFTITTGPFRSGGTAGSGGGDFATIFGDLMNNVPPQNHNPDDPNRPAGAERGPSPFGPTLQQFLSTILNPTGVHGDAVYSQEALDRIITQLMEANPQSHAAPPASEAAIQRLEKKQLDDKMLGPEGKAECTICIDEMRKGDEVTVLPCKHWFHGECVTLWLKEHNTCPICRAPIEEANSGGSGSRQHQGPTSESTEPSTMPPSSSSAQPPVAMFLHRPRERTPRSPRENADRLNAIRNLGGFHGQSSQSSQRRSSMSPPSPRAYSAAENNSRTRVRSPSLSRDRESPTSYYESGHRSSGRRGSDDDRRRDSQEGGNSNGPLNWIRNQFSRDSGSGSGSGRRRS